MWFDELTEILAYQNMSISFKTNEHGSASVANQTLNINNIRFIDTQGVDKRVVDKRVCVTFMVSGDGGCFVRPLWAAHETS
jgi:hypothetical protein